MGRDKTWSWRDVCMATVGAPGSRQQSTTACCYSKHRRQTHGVYAMRAKCQLTKLRMRLRLTLKWIMCTATALELNSLTHKGSHTHTNTNTHRVHIKSAIEFSFFFVNFVTWFGFVRKVFFNNVTREKVSRLCAIFYYELTHTHTLAKNTAEWKARQWQKQFRIYVKNDKITFCAFLFYRSAESELFHCPAELCCVYVCVCVFVCVGVFVGGIIYGYSTFEYEPTTRTTIYNSAWV